jgi:hypothetical protein
MSNFTRSLNTFAGGLTGGYLAGSRNLRENKVADLAQQKFGLEKDKYTAQTNAWKQLGDYYTKYLQMQQQGGGSAPGAAPMGVPANQVGVSADVVKGADNPQDVGVTQPTRAARPFVRSLPFLGDTFGED